MINFEGVKNEKMLRTMIKKNLNKEYHSNTRSSIDYINFLLDQAYESGIGYDVSDLKNAVVAFAANSTNQADYCVKLAAQMKFKSEEPSENVESDSECIVFYDVEVFPNLFLVNWKLPGKDKPVVRMINPKPSEIESLLRYKLIGFNNRRYDNHMLYACYIGYSNEQIYDLSKRIIDSPKGESYKHMFMEAYNISYTDVYDFSAKKQSLKKWEIELGIHHQELGLPWDQPVPEELWPKVAEYCDNDVIATEAVFDHLKGDWVARQILADLANGSYNDKTNTLTGKIIFGDDRKPQKQFNWRDMSQPVYEMDPEMREFLEEVAPEMMAEPHGEAKSLLPYFPGYTYDRGKSIYKGVEVGEGGRVFAEPGIWWNVGLLDIASQHPHSAIMEVLFGVKFTRRFYDVVYGRVHIKHEAWEEVNNILDGKLTPYIQKVIDGEMTADELADALKIAINSVYGLTAASFDTLFRDPRNKDNIVAKRGALFMVDLQEEVEKRGFKVAHIKTDSIKIPEATREIIDFVKWFGLRYGYTFEHEATYEKMCLVNDAVYIAKYHSVEWCEKQYGYIPTKQKKKAGKWDATGTQFQVPYVFKKLFSKEPIEFEDLCETKEVKGTAMYLDINESLPEGEHDLKFIGSVGSFCPIKQGCGGGELVRAATDKEGNTKYDAVTGTKGYRWLEAEMVKEFGKEADIDLSYYNQQVNDAIYGKGTGKQRKPGIADFGDFEMFVSDDPVPEQVDLTAFEHPVGMDLPWFVACGKETCYGCPNLNVDYTHFECTLGHDISDFAATQFPQDDDDLFIKR